MCNDCDGWKLRGIAKRDFRHSKDGPEEIKDRPRRKNKWCKNKTGQEHDFQQILWYTSTYVDSFGKERTHNSYRWQCKRCGKLSWSYPPKPKTEKHEHHFCLTEIADRRWKHAQEIFEVCCICGGKGRSYKFYE